MKLLDYITQIPKLFDWYFKLSALKRIQLNYICILAAVVLLAYYNDKLHRENNAALAARIDTINDARSTEQEKYTASLRFYTDKFNALLEKLLQQNQEIKKIKNES